MFVQDVFLYFIITRHKLTVYCDLFGFIYQRIIQSKSGGLNIGFYHGRKLYWSWSNGQMAASSKRMVQLSSAVEKADSE